MSSEVELKGNHFAAAQGASSAINIKMEALGTANEAGKVVK